MYVSIGEAFRGRCKWPILIPSNRTRETVVRELTDSTESQDDGPALRRRADEDGYVLIRGLLPPGLVRQLADELAVPMADAGWIPRDEPLETAPADRSKFCVEPQPAFMEMFYKQLALRSLHAVKLHPNLLRVFELLFDEERSVRRIS